MIKRFYMLEGKSPARHGNIVLYEDHMKEIEEAFKRGSIKGYAQARDLDFDALDKAIKMLSEARTYLSLYCFPVPAGDLVHSIDKLIDGQSDNGGTK